MSNTSLGMTGKGDAGIKRIRVESPPARRKLSTLFHRTSYFFFFAAFFFFLAATVAHLRSRVVGSEDEVGSPRSEPMIICFIAKHQLPSAENFRTQRLSLSETGCCPLAECIDCTLLDRGARQGKNRFQKMIGQ
jgi:hypothetical protein